MSDNEEARVPQDEAPNKSSVRFTLGFFLVLLLLILLFGVPGQKG